MIRQCLYPNFQKKKNWEKHAAKHMLPDTLCEYKVKIKINVILYRYFFIDLIKIWNQQSNNWTLVLRKKSWTFGSHCRRIRASFLDHLLQSISAQLQATFIFIIFFRSIHLHLSYPLLDYLEISLEKDYLEHLTDTLVAQYCTLNACGRKAPINIIFSPDEPRPSIGLRSSPPAA